MTQNYVNQEDDIQLIIWLAGPADVLVEEDSQLIAGLLG